MIGAALNAVLAQRLVRRICPKCCQKYEPPRVVRKALERMGYEFETFHRGVGCQSCRNTGFKGRIGVHELLVFDDELRDAIVLDPTVANIRKIAAQPADSRAGMVTLAHDGFRKVREGITTVEEVFHIAGDLMNSAGKNPESQP